MAIALIIKLAEFIFLEQSYLYAKYSRLILKRLDLDCCCKLYWLAV